MQEQSVLAQVALGYCPMIDRQRSVVATRLTVFPAQPDSRPDPAALLRALEEVWPAPEAGDDQPLKLTLRQLDVTPKGAAAAAATPGMALRTPVSLNLAGEDLLHAVLQAAPGPQLMIEVPAFMAGDPANTAALRALQTAGNLLLIKGRPVTPLTPEVLSCFAHCIVDVDEDRRSGPPPSGTVRRISTVQSGCTSVAEVEAAFERGSVAVVGWPMDEPPRPTGRQKVATDVTTVMELMQGVEREDPVPKLEAVLKRDPTLAFRLMRYLNSPAFGLSVEINSFAHALMLLGYTRLRRWLALLLASSAKSAYAQPLIYAAVRRGLLMEELGKLQADTEMRGEMFICGVFSLLDRLLEQPFAELLASVPVPERVQQTLRGEGGPYQPYLELVQAIEQAAVFDIRECTERLLLGPAEVNRALLAALASARQLDR